MCVSDNERNTICITTQLRSALACELNVDFTNTSLDLALGADMALLYFCAKVLSI